MRSRGNQREQAVARILRDLGYLVASLRHVGGPADLLAISPHFLTKHRNVGLSLRQLAWQHRPLLVEVKGTTRIPWHDGDGFSPNRRAEMIEAGVSHNVEPMLAWWPPGLRGGPMWLPVEDWPA